MAEGLVVDKSGAAGPPRAATTDTSQRTRGVHWRGMWRASALYSVAGALGKVGALLTVPVVTRALGRSDYGLLDLATALIAMATVIGGFSAELPAARFASAHPERGRQVLATYVGTVTVLSAAIAAAVALAAPLIADSVWEAPDATSLVLLSSAAIALIGVQLGAWNVHRLHARAGAYAVLSIIDMGLKVSLILAAVLLGGGVEAILVAYIAAAAVGAILGIWTIRGDLYWPLSLPFVPRLLGGGAPFIVTAVAFVVAGYWVRGLVAEAGSTSAVGEMAIAVRIASLLALPLAAFQFAWAPVGMTADQTPASRNAFFGSIFGVIAIGGLAAVGLSAFSPEVVRFFAGTAFAAGVDAVPGLAMATVLTTAFFMLAVAASAAEMSIWVVAITAAGGGALQVIATALLIGLLPEMTAVSLGAVLGSAAAVITLLALRGGAVDRSPLIGAATAAAVALTVMLQMLLAPDTPDYVRWGIGVVAWVLPASLLVRGARSAKPSATPLQQ